MKHCSCSDPNSCKQQSENERKVQMGKKTFTLTLETKHLVYLNLKLELILTRDLEDLMQNQYSIPLMVNYISHLLFNCYILPSVQL